MSVTIMNVTRDNRTLIFSGLSPDLGLPSNQLEVTVRYVDDGAGRGSKGLVLDNVIIPAIVEALQVRQATHEHLAYLREQLDG